MSRFLPSVRLLGATSLAWIVLFLLTPTLHPLRTAFCVTLLFILANAMISFRALTQQRQVLVVLNCVQIALFGMLSFQLHTAFGPDHYRCDREPRIYDWIEFTAA